MSIQRASTQAERDALQTAADIAHDVEFNASAIWVTASGALKSAISGGANADTINVLQHTEEVAYAALEAAEAVHNAAIAACAAVNQLAENDQNS